VAEEKEFRAKKDKEKSNENVQRKSDLKTIAEFANGNLYVMLSRITLLRQVRLLFLM
jgi:hypothetical protein